MQYWCTPRARRAGGWLRAALILACVWVRPPTQLPVPTKLTCDVPQELRERTHNVCWLTFIQLFARKWHAKPKGNRLEASGECAHSVADAAHFLNGARGGRTGVVGWQGGRAGVVSLSLYVFIVINIYCHECCMAERCDAACLLAYNGIIKALSHCELMPYVPLSPHYYHRPNVNKNFLLSAQAGGVWNVTCRCARCCLP